MKSTILSGRLAAAALLLTLAACDGDPSGPGDSQSTVSITYAGTGISGRYAATGEPSAALPPLRQDYAQGRRYASKGGIEVHSNATRSATMTDFSTIDIPRLTVGTSTIDPNCDDDWCASVSLAVEVGTTGVSQARQSCFLRQGSVTVTAVSDTRVRGTFSGTGHCLSASGTDDIEDFTITSGSFDVALVDLQG